MRPLIFLVALLFPALAQAQILELKYPCVDVGGVEGADYVPGVDVHGNAVVPANVGGRSAVSPLNYPIRIPVEIEALTFLNVMAHGDIEIGDQTEALYFELDKDGGITMNGQDVSSSIDATCYRAGGAQSDDVIPPPESGQQSPIDVGSGTNDNVEFGDLIEGSYP